MDKFKKMDNFMSANQNFQQYREVMNDLVTTNTPALPYLGFLLLLSLHPLYINDIL